MRALGNFYFQEAERLARVRSCGPDWIGLDWMG